MGAEVRAIKKNTYIVYYFTARGSPDDYVGMVSPWDHNVGRGTKFGGGTRWGGGWAKVRGWDKIGGLGQNSRGGTK